MSLATELACSSRRRCQSNSGSSSSSRSSRSRSSRSSRSRSSSSRLFDSSSSSLSSISMTTTTIVVLSAATVVVATTTAAAAIVVGLAATCFLRRLSQSVGVAAPTADMVQEENPALHCPLMRHVPILVHGLAWRSLGVSQPSPVHVGTVSSLTNNNNNNKTATRLLFYIKREDLIHTNNNNNTNTTNRVSLYGGNKVRTLQHQLAVCQVKRDRQQLQSPYRRLVATGSAGSNQVVATVLYGTLLGWDAAVRPLSKHDNNNDDTKTTTTTAAAASVSPPPPPAIQVCWPNSDPPDLDNTLNVLSVLSLSHHTATPPWTWGHDDACHTSSTSSSNLWTRVRALMDAWKQVDFVPMMLGGNCPTGVLGQVSGLLELAEQVRQGSAPPGLQRIYVAVGSACTVAGLILGVVLVQEHLRWRDVFAPNLEIVACVVHDKAAWLDRLVRFHLNPWFAFMPLTITHSVLEACRMLHDLGGPDLRAACRTFMATRVQLRANRDVIGRYGGHSDLSRRAAQHFDAHGVVTTYTEPRTKAQDLWICGHFVAKALQPLLVDLEEAVAVADKDTNQQQQQQEQLPPPPPPPPKYMLWMTKSAIQPRGESDEWAQLQAQNDIVKEWANAGPAESTLRPGKVNTETGSPADYRSLMTPITWPKSNKNETKEKTQ